MIIMIIMIIIHLSFAVLLLTTNHYYHARRVAWCWLAGKQVIKQIQQHSTALLVRSIALCAAF
jgi:hypothetical protein